MPLGHVRLATHAIHRIFDHQSELILDLVVALLNETVDLGLDYEVLRLHARTRPNLGVTVECNEAGILLPHQFIIPLIPPEKVRNSYWDLMTHSVVGLSSQGVGLIETYAYGSVETLKSKFPGANKDGVYMAPNFLVQNFFYGRLDWRSINGDLDNIYLPMINTLLQKYNTVTCGQGRFQFVSAK